MSKSSHEVFGVRGESGPGPVYDRTRLSYLLPLYREGSVRVRHPPSHQEGPTPTPTLCSSSVSVSSGTGTRPTVCLPGVVVGVDVGPQLLQLLALPQWDQREVAGGTTARETRRDPRRPLPADLRFTPTLPLVSEVVRLVPRVLVVEGTSPPVPQLRGPTVLSASGVGSPGVGREGGREDEGGGGRTGDSQNTGSTSKFGCATRKTSAPVPVPGVKGVNI